MSDKSAYINALTFIRHKMLNEMLYVRRDKVKFY